MIECYYHQCKLHPKDEPFCGEENCLATDEEIKQFKDEFSSNMANVQPMPDDMWETIKIATGSEGGGAPYHNIGVDKCDLCSSEDKENCNGCVTCEVDDEYKTI